MNPVKGEPLTMDEMYCYGKKGLEVLGDNPDHSSTKFTQFQQSHYGQYSVPLFYSLVHLLLPP